MEKNYQNYQKNQNITRLVVNFFVTVFVIVVILTVFLLALYYLTPNNYSIVQFDELKYDLVKEYLVNIKSNSNFPIPNLDSDNNYLKFKQIIDLDVPIENSNVPIENSNVLIENSNVPIENSNVPIDKFSNINLLIKNIIKSQSVTHNQDNLVCPLFGSNVNILNQSENNIKIKITIYKKK
jgi:hypothetical protein